MKVTKEEACQRIAEKLLEGFKVKNQKLYDELCAHILATGETPKIKLKWNSKTEDLELEFLK